MKNRKAQNFLMPEVLKMIVALACIIILIAVGYVMYGLLTKKTEIEQAKATLNNIIEKIEFIQEGQKTEYLMTGPKGGYLVKYAEGQKSPATCKGKNCLCICLGDVNLNYAGAKNYFNEDEGISICEKRGICKVVDRKVEFMTGSALTNSVVTKYISSFIILNPLPLELYLRKTKETIEVLLGEEAGEGEIFTNLLSSESEFLDQGKKSIRDQVLYYMNSGSAIGWRDANAREALTKNIQDYFKDYQFPLTIYILTEGQGVLPSGTPIGALEISAGPDSSSGEPPDKFPALNVENPGKSSIIIDIRLRKSWI